MVFADDIVLIDESLEGLNINLEYRRDALESKGFRISRTKLEYVTCNFSNMRIGHSDLVMIDGQAIPKSSNF